MAVNPQYVLWCYSELLRDDAEGSIRVLPKPVRLFWFLNLFLSLSCAALLLGGQVHLRHSFHGPHLPYYGFQDFLCFKPRFRHLHQLDFFSDASSYGLKFMYPAPVALLYESFYVFHWHTVTIFLLVTGSLVAVLGAMLGRAMVRRGVAPWKAAVFLGSVLLVSYPFWFEYLLSNMEICIFLIVSFGLLAFWRGRLAASAVLIGVAASMKIFPFVFLALFLSRRKYREFGLGIAVAAAMNVFALWMVCPSLGVSYRGIEAGLAAFRVRYMLRYLPIETGFDHSIFGFVKQVAHQFGHGTPSRWLTVYLALAAVSGVALYFLRIRKLPLLNQILCLCVCSILLPPTSHDYTLVHLYVPWGLMVLYALDAARARQRVEGLAGVFVCFAILMSAENELVYHTGFSGQLKAVTLVVLLVIGLRRPFALQQETVVDEEMPVEVYA